MKPSHNRMFMYKRACIEDSSGTTTTAVPSSMKRTLRISVHSNIEHALALYKLLAALLGILLTFRKTSFRKDALSSEDSGRSGRFRLDMKRNSTSEREPKSFTEVRPLQQWLTASTFVVVALSGIAKSQSLRPRGQLTG